MKCFKSLCKLSRKVEFDRFAFLWGADSFSLSKDVLSADSSRWSVFGMPVVIFGIIGVILLFLLLLNVVLIIVCLRRKRTQMKVNSYTSTPTRLANGALAANGQHNVQFSPLPMEHALDDQYGIDTLPAYAFEPNAAANQFLNGSTVTYHRSSDPSDLQNIALNDFTSKDVRSLVLLLFSPTIFSVSLIAVNFVRSRSVIIDCAS